MIEALGLYIGTVNGKATLAEANQFVEYKDIEVVCGDFSYSMLLGCYFTSGCSHPDITHAVSYAIYSMSCPRH